MVEPPLRRRGVAGGGEIGDGFAGGDEAEAAPGALQTGEEGAQRIVLQLALLRPGRMLERLQAIEDEQGAVPRDERGEARALVPRGRGAVGQLGVAEELERGGDEDRGVGGGLRTGVVALGTRALAVKRPVEVTLHAAMPLAREQRLRPPRGDGGLPRPADGDQRDDPRPPGLVGERVGPQGIEVGEDFFAAFEDASVVFLRELGDGHLEVAGLGRGLAAFEVEVARLAFVSGKALKDQRHRFVR